MEAFRHSLRYAFLLAIATCAVLPTSAQRFPSDIPLVVRVNYGTVDRDTKYVVTFKNVGKEPVEWLKIQKVGLNALSRDFSPPHDLPTIRPGKTYTFNVYVRGIVDVAAPDDLILVLGTYRSGTRSYVMNYGFRIDELPPR